jgi:hypothetical protein
MVEFPRQKVMISGMYQEDENKAEKDSLLNKWRQGRLAERHEVSIVVLALVLVLCLLAAQIMVSAGTGRIQAEDNGKEIIEKVSQQGLINTLGRQTITRYYLTRRNGQNTGYWAMIFEPKVLPDGSWVLTGKELTHDIIGHILSQSSFEVADDLSWQSYYNNLQITMGKKRATFIQEYTIDQGVLRYSYTSGRRRSKLPPINVKQWAFVPVLLVDFFSSLAAEQAREDGAVFYVVNPNVSEDLDHIISDLWVQPGGKVPQEIIDRTPQGRKVEVKWLQSNRFQRIYIDNEHQLVWQKETDPQESIITAVTREELLETFADAEQVLQMWLTTESENEDNYPL